MKKKAQYSDKYGRVVAEGEVVEERVAPGITFEAPVTVEPEVEEVEEVEEDEEVVEDDE